MYCKKCGNKISDNEKFCGKCGNGVLTENKQEPQTLNKKFPSVSEMLKRIFQIIAIILFILSLGTISSNYNQGGWLENIHDIFVIIIAITLVKLIVNWKNKRTDEKWFGWRWIIFLIFLSILSFGTVIFSQSLVIAHQKAIASVDGWNIYNAPDNSFSARFPSSPVYSTKSQDTTNGTLKIDTYKQADQTASVLYAVNVTDFPKGTDLTGMLEKSVNLSAKNGTLINSNQTTNNGYPAISYYIEFDSPTETSMIKGINVLVGQRLYQLLVAYDKPQENISEFEKFVGSFQIN